MVWFSRTGHGTVQNNAFCLWGEIRHQHKVNGLNPKVRNTGANLAGTGDQSPVTDPCDCDLSGGKNELNFSHRKFQL